MEAVLILAELGLLLVVTARNGTLETASPALVDDVLTSALTRQLFYGKGKYLVRWTLTCTLDGWETKVKSRIARTRLPTPFLIGLMDESNPLGPTIGHVNFVPWYR